MIVCTDCGRKDIVPAPFRMIRKQKDGTKTSLCVKCASARGAKPMLERVKNGTWAGSRGIR